MCILMTSGQERYWWGEEGEGGGGGGGGGDYLAVYPYDKWTGKVLGGIGCGGEGGGGLEREYERGRGREGRWRRGWRTKGGGGW